jgi:hypothetical protein
MDGYTRMISDNMRGLTNEMNGKGMLLKLSTRSNKLHVARAGTANLQVSRMEEMAG